MQKIKIYDSHHIQLVLCSDDQKIHENGNQGDIAQFDGNSVEPLLEMRAARLHRIII